VLYYLSYTGDFSVGAERSEADDFFHGRRYVQAIQTAADLSISANLLMF